MEQTLLLNATYEPMQVVSWKRAIRMHFQDKVEVVEVYPRQIRSMRVVLPLPSVVRLLHYVKIRRHHRAVRFSRSNIFARDRYHCQYCGLQLPSHELTCDHVMPVARGGERSWENIVTCCVPCNRRKGSRTPSEAGLQLSRRPKAPSSFGGRLKFVLARSRPPETWQDYIFWIAGR